MRISYFFYYSFVLILGLAACTCNRGSGNFATQNPISFEVVDRITNEDLIQIGQTRYNLDSIKILDSNFKVLLKPPAPLDGVFFFDFMNREEDKNNLGSIITRKFYLYFYKDEIDTIQIEYSLKSGDCDVPEINYMKITFNDEIYFDGITNRVPGGLYFKK